MCPHHVQCVWCFLYSTWSCFDSRPEVVLICLLLSWACVVVWDRCLIWTTDLTEQRRACKVRNTPSGIVCEEFLRRSNGHHDCGQHLPVGWKLRWNARWKESHRIQAFSLSALFAMRWAAQSIHPPGHDTLKLPKVWAKISLLLFLSFPLGDHHSEV